MLTELDVIDMDFIERWADRGLPDGSGISAVDGAMPDIDDTNRFCEDRPAE